MRELKLVALVTALLAAAVILRMSIGTAAEDSELEAAFDAVEAKRWPRTPLFEEAAPGTAWDYYRQAMGLLTRAENASPEAKAAFAAMKRTYDFKKEIPEAVRELITTLEPAFALLRRGACAKESGRFFSPRYGSAANKERDAAMPTALMLRQAVNARAYLLVRESPGEAVDALLVLYRFGDDFRRGAPALPFIVGASVRNSAVVTLAELAGAGCLPGDQMERLLTWSAIEAKRTPDLFEVVDNRMLSVRMSLRQMADEALRTGLDVDSMGPDERKELAGNLRKVAGFIGEAWATAKKTLLRKGAGSIATAFANAVRRKVTMLTLADEVELATMLRDWAGTYGKILKNVEQIPDQLLAYRTALMFTLLAQQFREKNDRFPISIAQIIEFEGGDFPGAGLLHYRPPGRPGAPDPAIYLKATVMAHGESRTFPIATLHKPE